MHIKYTPIPGRPYSPLECNKWYAEYLETSLRTSSLRTAEEFMEKGWPSKDCKLYERNEPAIIDCYKKTD